MIVPPMPPAPPLVTARKVPVLNRDYICVPVEWFAGLPTPALSKVALPCAGRTLLGVVAPLTSAPVDPDGPGVLEKP